MGYFLSPMSAKTIGDTERDFLTGDKIQQEVQRWLSPPDPWKNHNLARKFRHSETGTWWIQGDTYTEWKSSDRSSLLWIHGKRQYFASDIFPRN